MRKIFTVLQVFLLFFCSMDLLAKNKTCGETVACYLKCPNGGSGATCQNECLDDSTPNSKSKFTKFNQCIASPQVDLCVMGKQDDTGGLVDCFAQHCIQEMQGCFGINKDYFDFEKSRAKCFLTIGLYNQNCEIFAKSLSTKNALMQEEEYLSCRNKCKTDSSTCNAQVSCRAARCESKYPNKLSENLFFSKSDLAIINQNNECLLQNCSSESNIFLVKICGIANGCYSKVPKTKGSTADFPFLSTDYPNSCTQIVSEISYLPYPSYEKAEKKANLPTETIALKNLIDLNRVQADTSCASSFNEPQSFTYVFSNLSDAQEKYKIMLLSLYGCYRRNLKEMGLMNNDYSINFTALSEENKKILLQRCSQEINECENSLGNRSQKGKNNNSWSTK